MESDKPAPSQSGLPEDSASDSSPVRPESLSKSLTRQEIEVVNNHIASAIEAYPGLPPIEKVTTLKHFSRLVQQVEWDELRLQKTAWEKQEAETKLKESEEANKRLADLLEEKTKEAHELTFDSISGLHRPDYFTKRVEEFLGKRGRKEVRCAMGCVDLALFKEVNDNFGHDVGDMFLAKVGKIIDSIRESHAPYSEEEKRARRGIYDTACRIGDEYRFLLAEVATAEDCTVIARRIVKEISEISIEGLGSLGVSADVGVVYCILQPDSFMTINYLLVTYMKRWSDSLMYKAKKFAKALGNQAKVNDHIMVKTLRMPDILEEPPFSAKPPRVRSR